jgi:hypothetical protein
MLNVEVLSAISTKSRFYGQMGQFSWEKQDSPDFPRGAVTPGADPDSHGMESLRFVRGG